MSAFSKNIIFLRSKLGKTQAQLGAAAGVSPATVNNWENEKTEPIISQLMAIAQYLDISVEDLIYTEVDKGNPIENTRQKSDHKKSNLYTGKEPPEAETPVVNEGQMPYCAPLLQAVLKMSQNIEQMRVIMEEGSQASTKKR